jgi:hypothetical protein
LPYRTKPYVLFGVGSSLRGITYTVDDAGVDNRRLREVGITTERASLPLADASAIRMEEPSVLLRTARKAAGIGDVQVAGANFSHVCKNIADVNAFIAAIVGTHPDVQPPRESLGQCAKSIALVFKQGTVGFGDRPQTVSTAERAVVSVKHQSVAGGGKATPERLVSWTVNGDGTVTSEQDRLTWIQGPWGTRWEGGSEFSGEPCRLSWRDATRLFGRGADVGLSESGTIALSPDQVRSTSADAGYSTGSCRVVFAGHTDWRLATVADWNTVIGLEWAKGEGVFPRYKADERYWTATGRHEPGLQAIPDLVLRLFRSERTPLAWVGNFGRWILDCGVDERYPVMFVRNT